MQPEASTHSVVVPLPEERVPSVGRRELAIVVIVPLVFALVLNGIVAWGLREHPGNRGYAVTAAKWRLLATLAEPVQTLVLGDSSCNQGIDPEVLARRLGGRALNLCTTGDSIAVGDAWMLGAYLERHGRPERVVVMHAYDVWARDDRALRRQAWVLGEHRGLFAGKPPLLDFTLGEAILLRVGRHAPLYVQPMASRELLADPSLAFASRRGMLSRAGFMAVDRAVPARVVRDAKAHLRKTRGRVFRPSKPNLAALEVLVRTSREHGFSLYLAHSPLYAALWERDTFRAYHARVSHALSRELRGSPHAALLFQTPELFPAKHMENVDHLVTSAARGFSELFADRIAELER